MHRLVVMYPRPDDPVKFRDYYEAGHYALGRKIPNVRNMHFSYDVKAMPADASGIIKDLDLFCVFVAEWDSEAAMYQALGSPEGQAVLADVSNYASTAFVFHYPIPDQRQASPR